MTDSDTGTSNKPSATTSTAESTAETVDWTQCFATTRIKTILQKEPAIGVLPKQTLEMIGASSALFVQKLLHAARGAAANTDQPSRDSATAAVAVPGSNSKASQQPVVVTAANVRQAIKADDSWSFLSAVLEKELAGTAGDDTATTSHLLPRKRTTKRRSAGTASKKQKTTAASVLSEDPIRDEKAVVEEALQVASLEQVAMAQKEIEEDEEDYDE